MEHIGIDLGSRTSHICIMNSETAKVSLETKMPTGELAPWLAKRPAARVAMETCTESFAVADQLSLTKHEVTVVPANRVRELGVGRRKIKNDRRDAQVLAKSSLVLGDELPSVHVPSSDARHVRRHLAHRAVLVNSRTMQINAVKAMFRQELIVLSGGTASCFPKRIREALTGDPLLAIVEPILCAIEQTSCSIALYEKMIVELTKSDPRVARVKTVPGIGPVTGAMFVAVVDDIKRFPSGAHLASYLGLTPGEKTTGGKTKLLGITRAGQRHLRSLMIQASWALIRFAPDTALAKRFERLATSKRRQVAIVATARRLCVVLHAMLRDGKNFNSLQGLSPLDATARNVVEEFAEVLHA